MQAIILAAGFGNRIKSVSNGLPKSYLKINGETLLERNIRLLKENGINDIILVTGYQHNLFSKDFAEKVTYMPYNPFYRTTNVLASFWFGAPFLKEDAIYLHADTVFHAEILSGLISAEGGEVILSCDKKVCGEEEMKYTSEEGNIKLLNKSMEPCESEGEFLGVCKLSKDIYPILMKKAEQILSEERFQSFFEVAIQELIDQQALIASIYDVGGLPWCEIDFPEDYELAKKMLGE